MPRDLFEGRPAMGAEDDDTHPDHDDILNGMPELGRSARVHPSYPSEHVEELDPDDSSGYSTPDEETKDKIAKDMERQDALSEMKPYPKGLTISDVESCVKLEDATFPLQERCSREKFEYRFTKCQLSLGMYTSATEDDSESQASSAPTIDTAQIVYSGAPERKLVLLAHCVVTKTTNSTIMDADMALPPDWEESGTLAHSPDPSLGHKEEGRTVCIHSLAVLPAYQGRGLGTMLMKAYIQRIEQSGAADRIALLAHDELVNFYAKLGFEVKGPSKATFGGGGWVDMVLELKNQPLG
ncbi:hypothetical protein BT93_L0231 [Corymbia citriodora subsp. variegata]|uniref:N-acetyltransferase domain-containing protein n=1 Tax=Corymbia citriodora subsp. variegata TaxID=360336 RepID=A0A8T0CEP5_CORYI|nr:hypothetical protein BT93_L0231 [Corymbia citriodora subsp. variegata]